MKETQPIPKILSPLGNILGLGICLGGGILCQNLAFISSKTLNLWHQIALSLLALSALVVFLGKKENRNFRIVVDNHFLTTLVGSLVILWGDLLGTVFQWATINFLFLWILLQTLALSPYLKDQRQFGYLSIWVSPLFPWIQRVLSVLGIISTAQGFLLLT